MKKHEQVALRTAANGYYQDELKARLNILDARRHYVDRDRGKRERKWTLGTIGAVGLTLAGLIASEAGVFSPHSKQSDKAGRNKIVQIREVIRGGQEVSTNVPVSSSVPLEEAAYVRDHPKGDFLKDSP